MKRSSIRAFALLGAMGICLSTGVANASVASYPSDPFPRTCNEKSGCVSGVVGWSNRSAIVDVTLYDDRNAGSTTVIVDFYTANGWYGTDTRTVNNDTITGHPSMEGPVGGISEVSIYLKANIDTFWPPYYVGTFYRDF